MPGKYLEFIKCGRYVVPVELTFLPLTYTDVLTANCVTTSKWVDKSHWKEIKALLRPAVESVSKAHETGSGKVTSSHHVAHGVDISFGYIIEVSKDKVNFLAVLDPQKNCWTDDEEEQENVLMDLGGRHQNLIPTDWYVKAVVLKRSLSTLEDAKRIRKELGIKTDDVRSFLTASNSEKTKGTPTGDDDEKENESTNSKGETSDEDEEDDEDDDDDDDGPSTETESLMEIPPPSGKVLQPTPAVNHLVSKGFVSLRPSCFNNTPRQNDALDEASLRRLYRQCSPPGDNCGFWNDDLEDSDDEELPDIEEFSLIVSYSKDKKTGKNKSPRKRGGSPHKHRCAETGLPDIDEGKTKVGRGSSGKRKRTVAIVEPMKPVNPEETSSESRKRKSRNLNFSPTFGLIARGGGVAAAAAATTTTVTGVGGGGVGGGGIAIAGGSNNSNNSAIEILQEDSDLLPIPDYTPTVPKRKSDPSSSKKHRKKKRTPRTDSPSGNKSSSEGEDDEDDDEGVEEEQVEEEQEQEHEEQVETLIQQQKNAESDGVSEPEMPMLDRMVSTSDEEEHIKAREQETARLVEVNPFDPALEIEEVIRISQEITQVISDVENNASSESEHQETQTVSPPPPQVVTSPVSNKKRVKKKLKTPVQDEMRNVRQLSPDMSTLGVGVGAKRARKYAASDSDDITSESAYRKKPMKKRRKKKRIQTPSEENCLVPMITDSRTTTGDAQTQTIFSPVAVAATTTASVKTVEKHRVEREREREREEPVARQNENKFDGETTLIVVSKRERSDFDTNFAETAAFSDENDDVLYDGEIQSDLYLPALGSPEEGVDSLDLFNFETIVPNPLYNQEPPLIKLSPQGGNEEDEEDEEDDEETENIPLVSLLLNDEQNQADFEEQLAHHENEDDDEDDEEIESLMVDMDPSLDYTFDIANNLAKRVKDKPIPDPILRRALQLNASDDSDDHNDEPEEDSSNPKQMSTFALMTNPNTLKASLSLFDQIKISDPAQEDKDREMMPPPLLRRPSSPDICSLNPEARMKRPKLKKQAPPKIRPDSPQPGSSKQMYQVQDPLLQEYLCRVDQGGSMNETNYEPSGDQFDLSQRSYCMLPVVSNYATKSRMYKIHSKNIRDMTHERIKEEFDLIKPQIRGIFEGSYPSERNKIYCEKKKKQDSIQKLESMALRYSPFENNQIGWLIALINEYLVPQPGSRIKYVDYIKHVMIPEACIRIYSKINEISWERSETELTCGACYQDDDLLEN